MRNKFVRIAGVVLVVHGWLSAVSFGVEGVEKPAPEKKATPTKKAAPAKKAKPEGEYLRIRRNDAGKAVALETAIVRYMGTGKNEGATVDLIGAIHVGEGTYYEELNKRFADYDALLFELVAPEGIRIEEGQQLESKSPISALQTGLQGFLGLEFQLEQIDYSKQNFVHADMSPEEFAKTMKDRGESFFGMLLKMMGQSMAMQAGNAEPVNDAELLFALVRRDRATLKRLLAEQLQGMEGALNALGGADGASTIVTERNKKALVVLKRELEAGKKKVGIFYGAGHLSDMDTRLQGEFGMQRGEKQWLSAWDLTKDHSKAKNK